MQSINAKNTNETVTNVVTATDLQTYHTNNNINGTTIHHGAAKNINNAPSKSQESGCVNGSKTVFKTSFAFRNASSTPAVNSLDCGNDGHAL